MLNRMIEETFNDGSVHTMSIYRHFKGGYYVVLSFATIESTGEEVVVYQSLQDGRMWVRPLSVFRELVPEGRENPTGQKYRFEQVTKFNNQLNMVSTDTLVKELLSRSDCPDELQTSSDKVWRVQYLVGRYDTVFVDIDKSYEDFFINNIFDSLEKAVAYVERNPNFQILKQVSIKQDFD